MNFSVDCCSALLFVWAASMVNVYWNEKKNEWKAYSFCFCRALITQQWMSCWRVAVMKHRDRNVTYSLSTEPVLEAHSQTSELFVHQAFQLIFYCCVSEEPSVGLMFSVECQLYFLLLSVTLILWPPPPPLQPQWWRVCTLLWGPIWCQTASTHCYPSLHSLPILTLPSLYLKRLNLDFLSSHHTFCICMFSPDSCTLLPANIHFPFYRARPFFFI